jgi:hypothetical protein
MKADDRFDFRTGTRQFQRHREARANGCDARLIHLWPRAECQQRP